MSRRRPKWTGPTYRRVALREAEDPRILTLPDLEHRVWTLARFGSQSTRHGLGVFSVGQAAELLDRPVHEVRAALDRVCEALGWIFEARWLYVPEALEVAWDGSASQLIGYLREIERASPPPALLARFRAAAAQLRPETTTTTDTYPPTTGDRYPPTSATPPPLPPGASTRTRTRTRDSYSYTGEKREPAVPASSPQAATPSQPLSRRDTRPRSHDWHPVSEIIAAMAERGRR